LPGGGFLFWQFANPFGVSNPKRVVSPEDQKTRRSDEAPVSSVLSWQALPAKSSDKKYCRQEPAGIDSAQAGVLAELPGRCFLFWQFANPFGVSNPERVVSPEDQKTRRSDEAPASSVLSWQVQPAKSSDKKNCRQEPAGIDSAQAGALAELPGRCFLFLAVC
jgi:hypothetical protein